MLDSATNDQLQLLGKISALEAHFSHITKRLDNIEESIKDSDKEIKLENKFIRGEIQEIKDLINQGRGVYKFINALYILLGGGIGALILAFVSIIKG